MHSICLARSENWEATAGDDGLQCPSMKNRNSCTIRDSIFSVLFCGIIVS